MKNLIYHKPQFEKFQKKRGLIPEMCFFELTYICNLNCAFCINNKKRPSRYTFENIKKILKILREKGIVEVRFTGGEFLTYKNWQEILKFAKKQGFLCTILSNAIWFDKFSDKDVRLINDIGISFHSADPEIYEKITQVKGSFPKLIKGLKKLKENCVNFSINYTLTKDNFLTLYSSIKTLINQYEIPVKALTINRLIEAGSAIENWNNIFQIDYNQIFSQIEKLKNEFNIHIRFTPMPLCHVPKEYQSYVMSCGTGNSFFVIDWEGNIKICPAENRFIGNVFSQPIEEIFQSEFWRGAAEKKWLPEKCRRCEFLGKKCVGGCYMNAIQLPDNSFAPDNLLKEPVSVLASSMIKT